jgi:hypothetical protein
MNRLALPKLELSWVYGLIFFLDAHFLNSKDSVFDAAKV